MKKLKVLFIWPNYEDTMLGLPLGFAYLISNCRSEKFEFKLIDCKLDGLNSSDSDLVRRIDALSPTIIAVSASSSNFNEALEILHTSKNLDKDIITIIGGPHATAYGRQAFECEDIDFLFMGEAEVGFKEFLDSFVDENAKAYSEINGLAYKDNNGNRYFSEPAKIENLDSLIPPDYDAINLEGYIEKGYNYLSGKKRCAPIYCTRGCPYECKFCSVPSISGKKVRKHSVPYLINMVKYLYEKKGIRGFNVVDDNFTFYVNFAKDFCREIIKLGFPDIEFNSPNGIRMQRGDFELWTLMKQAGWNTITVAPESGSPRILQLMKKDLDPDVVPGIVAEMKKAGLKINGFFILGFPGETIEDLQKTEKLISLCHFDNISATFFQPMPGTPIYDELIKQGELSAQQLPGYFGDSDTHLYMAKSLEGIDLPTYRRKLLKLTWVSEAVENLSTHEDLSSLNNIFVVGAGTFAVRVLEKLGQCVIPVGGIVDELLQADMFHGINVFSFNRNTFEKSKVRNSIFLMAISDQHYRSNALGRLVNNGVPPDRILYFEPSAFDEIFDKQFIPLLKKIPYFKQHDL